MKQDPKLVAAKQRHEMKYIAERFGIPVKTVKDAVKSVGRSRRKVYACLKLWGYALIRVKPKRKTV
jgi:hypothetical protein